VLHNFYSFKSSDIWIIYQYNLELHVHKYFCVSLTEWYSVNGNILGPNRRTDKITTGDWDVTIQRKCILASHWSFQLSLSPDEIKYGISCMFVRASSYKRREENKQDAAEWFIALIICSSCFGHLYAHLQKLETILVLLPHTLEQLPSSRKHSLPPCTWPPTTSKQGITHHMR